MAAKKKWIVTGRVTVSCYTVVEAETAEKAKEIAAERSATLAMDGGWSPDGSDSFVIEDVAGKVDVVDAEPKP